MFSPDTRYLLKKIKQILKFSAVVICDNQYDEFLFFNCTKNSTHLKIMVLGLRGPAGGPCKSEDITRWGLNGLIIHHLIMISCISDEIMLTISLPL